MCNVCDSSKVFSPCFVEKLAREQLATCRADITLEANRLRATTPTVEETHLLALAIVEYFALETAIETSEAEQANGV